MSKPNNRMGEFMRQHKRILEERAVLLAKVEALETGRERDIAKAVEKVVADNRTLVDELASVVKRNVDLNRTNASQADCIEAMKTQLADRQADIERLALKLDNTAPEFKRLEGEHATNLAQLQQIHDGELAGVRADIARMDELAARIEERGRKKEQEEARALLNRQAMAQVVPSRNYRA